MSERERGADVDASRRRVLGTLAGAWFAPAIRLGAEEIPAGGGQPDDEAYWARVRAAFDLPPGITNLDNAALGPLPRSVMDDLLRITRSVEELPEPRLEELFSGTSRKLVMPRLAALLGVPNDEIALVRNATEALATVLLGVPLRAGDEVVYSAHDYWATQDALLQRQMRDGIVLRRIQPPVPAPSSAALARLYQEALTSRTRLVLVTHASNVTGQICPVRAIADAAHRAGAEVVVDAAQTFALVPHSISELGCDYYGASLHKWLLGPVGAGVLWMRRGRAAQVWPLVPAPLDVTDMRRYTHCGTHPDQASAATLAALDLHERIGATRKADRVRYLTRYWRSKLATLPGVRFYTTEDPEMCCGLGIFDLAGVESTAVCKRLWNEHRIVIQAVAGQGRSPEIRGVRVSANVYTSLPDLDLFLGAVQAVAAEGSRSN